MDSWYWLAIGLVATAAQLWWAWRVYVAAEAISEALPKIARSLAALEKAAERAASSAETAAHHAKRIDFHTANDVERE